MWLRGRRLVYSILLLGLVSMVQILPVDVVAQSSSEDLKSGPYIDTIRYDVILQDDEQVLALQNGNIDIIGDEIDSSFVDTLLETEDIAVAETLRNGYEYMVINCQKYPFNYTAFRRALAFALDKEAIVEDVWNAHAEPLDSVIPKISPWSIEGQLPYTYYEANVERGNALLDQYGFDIDPVTGFREAPNGEPFDVLIECTQSSDIAIEVGEYVADALTDLHIDAVSVPTDFYEYLNRLYFHGEYDMVILGKSFTDLGVDWLANEFWSENAGEPYLNFANFRNESFDSWRDQLLYSPDYNEVYEAAIEMQRILMFECPFIVCSETVLYSAYRTDTFEGQANDILDGISSSWTNYRARLRQDNSGPYGGTLRISSPLGFNNFNIMMLYSAMTPNVILPNLYDSLIKITPDGSDILWLAETVVTMNHQDNPDIPEGHTRFIISILQNATWSDGTSLTADDVVYSLVYYRDSPGNPIGVQLQRLSAVYTPTLYSLIIEFETESYWNLHNFCYLPILQQDMLVDIGIDAWNLWNPDPSNDSFITSGPFTVSAIGPNYVELTKNPTYFYQAVAPVVPTTLNTSNIPTGTFTIPYPTDELQIPLLSIALTAPSVVVIAIVLYKWKSETHSRRSE